MGVWPPAVGHRCGVFLELVLVTEKTQNPGVYLMPCYTHCKPDEGSVMGLCVCTIYSAHNKVCCVVL